MEIWNDAWPQNDKVKENERQQKKFTDFHPVHYHYHLPVIGNPMFNKT